MEEKMMNEKKPNKIIDVTFILSTLLCFGPMIYGLIMWKKLPEQMPIHFNADGNVDSWGGRWMNVILFPLLMILGNAIVHLSFNIKARKMGENVNSKLPYVFKWFMPVLCYAISFIVYSYSFGKEIDPIKIVTTICSILFIIIGNYFPKLEKWMLNIPVKDENLTWVKRTLGWAFMIAGLVSLIFSFTPAGIWVFLSAAGIVVVVLFYCASKAEQ
jgi:uncharacterized membrane protein